MQANKPVLLDLVVALNSELRFIEHKIASAQKGKEEAIASDEHDFAKGFASGFVSGELFALKRMEQRLREFVEVATGKLDVFQVAKGEEYREEIA